MSATPTIEAVLRDMPSMAEVIERLRAGMTDNEIETLLQDCMKDITDDVSILTDTTQPTARRHLHPHLFWPGGWMDQAG